MPSVYSFCQDYAGHESWSAIGRNALEVEPENPTMNLGGIDEANPSEMDRAIVLHQVGHALGPDDEWHDDAIDLVCQEEDQVLVQHLRRYEEHTFSVNNNTLGLRQGLISRQLLPRKVWGRRVEHEEGFQDF